MIALPAPVTRVTLPRYQRGGRAAAPGARSVPRRLPLIGWTGPLIAGLLIVGAMQFVGIAGNISFGGTPVPQADLLRQNIGYSFVFVAGALIATVPIAVTATLASRIELFRTWQLWASYVLAFILVFAVIFTPMAALPVWVLGTSVVLLRRRAHLAV